MSDKNRPDTLRLDKWLWAARFFKTRQLACEAISGGKVHLNGQRTKPGKDVKVGSELRIHKGSLEWDLTVLGINKQRRPAPEAVLLYQESEESLAQRHRLAEEHRLQRLQNPTPVSRPSKKDRRQIHRFIKKEG